MQSNQKPINETRIYPINYNWIYPLDDCGDNFGSNEMKGVNGSVSQEIDQVVIVSDKKGGVHEEEVGGRRIAQKKHARNDSIQNECETDSDVDNPEGLVILLQSENITDIVCVSGNECQISSGECVGMSQRTI